MEALRRARLIWASICIVAGVGTAAALLTSTYEPALMQKYAFATAIACTALWLPLYTRWAPIVKLAAVWFIGVTLGASIAAREPSVMAGFLSGVGVIGLAVVWVISGFWARRRA